MKICTDIEQSKKLAEIIPMYAADCQQILQGNGEYREAPLYDYKLIEEDDIPAWSLTALINLFPAYKEDSTPTFSLTRGGWTPSFTRNWFATWGNWSFDAIEPIDAVVGLMLLLKENNVEFYNPLV